MSRITRILRPARRFRRDEDGTATVEFVLWVPILCALFGGCLVFAEGFMLRSMATRATYTVGDIISRRQTIDNTYIEGLRDLYEYMSASSLAPNLRVTTVRRKADGEYTIDWSYSTDEQTAFSEDDYSEISQLIPDMSPGDTVILTQTLTYYDPLIDLGIGLEDTQWQLNAVIRPRFVPKLTNTDFPEATDAVVVADGDAL